MKLQSVKSLVVAAAALAMTHTAAGSPMEPKWDASVTTNQARLMQPFTIDGMNVRVDKVSEVNTFADGTPPDVGARIVEVEFWAHNPSQSDMDFYDRFYAYAVMGDASDTDGEGLSFYPLDSGKEFGDVTLKPNQTQHARFDVEVPEKPGLDKLVVFGPIDGVKVTIPLPQPRQKM